MNKLTFREAIVDLGVSGCLELAGITVGMLAVALLPLAQLFTLI